MIFGAWNIDFDEWFSSMLIMYFAHIDYRRRQSSVDITNVDTIQSAKNLLTRSRYQSKCVDSTQLSVQEFFSTDFFGISVSIVSQMDYIVFGNRFGLWRSPGFRHNKILSVSLHSLMNKASKIQLKAMKRWRTYRRKRKREKKWKRELAELILNDTKCNAILLNRIIGHSMFRVCFAACVGSTKQQLRFKCSYFVAFNFWNFHIFTEFRFFFSFHSIRQFLASVWH